MFRNGASIWKPWEVETVTRELYCVARTYPGVNAEQLDAWIQANARELVIQGLEHVCTVQEGAVTSHEQRRPELEAEVTNARHDYARQSAEEQLRTHERWAKKSGALARRYRRLVAKIREHGLPSRDAGSETASPPNGPESGSR